MLHPMVLLLLPRMVVDSEEMSEEGLLSRLNTFSNSTERQHQQADTTSDEGKSPYVRYTTNSKPTQYSAD